VSAISSNCLAIGIDRPNDTTVEMIVAASSAAVRRMLVELTERANFEVLAVAADPATLAHLLERDRDASVVTGGPVTLARPFLSRARSANAATVAILSDRAAAEDRLNLSYGGLAVLRAVPPIERFRAATLATHTGLSVWDSDLRTAHGPSGSNESPLSPRERTVLELTGGGLSTKSVARKLGISPNTVKFHLQAAFAKLGVTTRAEAVMAAIRRGELAV
jgi:DNA-binding CsgD family transcriptional regulator